MRKENGHFLEGGGWFGTRDFREAGPEMGREQRKELIRELEAYRQSRLLCFLTSDRPGVQAVIAKDFIPRAYNHLRGSKRYGRLDVFFFTLGGDTLAAFGLSRTLREFADTITVLVPEKCHSAGTLFALGANLIFMSPVATLSPIDPSVSGPLNPFVEPVPGQRQQVPISVESVAGYQTLVKEDWRLGEKGAADAFQLLAQQVTPVLLGDVYRRRQQIELLAKKLLRSHRVDARERDIDDVVESLTRKLGSHDYLISRAEAKELMASQIADLDEKLEGLVWALYEDFSEDMKLGQAFDISAIVNTARTRQAQFPVSETQKVVIIESSVRSDIWEREFLLNFGPPLPGQPGEQIQAQVLYNGWRTHS